MEFVAVEEHNGRSSSHHLLLCGHRRHSLVSATVWRDWAASVDPSILARRGNTSV